MSRYVVDASVVIQRLVQEPQTEYARALFHRLLTGDDLIVPEFCILECTNVLWKRVRFQGLVLSQAEALIADLISLPLQIWTVNHLMKRALRIGVSNQLAVYDSTYIALAEALNCPLITVDEKQASVAHAEGIPLKPLQDFSALD